MNCCSGNGAWAGTCSESEYDGGEHTWTEGFDACKGVSPDQLQATEFESSWGADDKAPDGETPGGIHEYPGELSVPLQKAEQAIAAGLSGSYDSVVAGTEGDAQCSDDNAEQCPLWAQKGECEANSAYMRASCKLSCGACFPISARRKDNVSSSSPSPLPAVPLETAAAVSSPSPLVAKAQARADDEELSVVQRTPEEAQSNVERYNKTAPEKYNTTAPESPQGEHGELQHANEYVAAERARLVKEQALRDAAATEQKQKAESLMSKDEKDELDRKEYQAAIANALASAKTATRDPGDRMEVWEQAISKAIDKKAASSAKETAETLEPGQLRSPTKEEKSKQEVSQAALGDSKGGASLVARPFETKTAQFHAFARSSTETAPSSEASVSVADASTETAPPVAASASETTSTSETTASPTESKGAPFAAFATAHAAAREVCKGKQGECV